MRKPTTRKYVVFNGLRVLSDWPERLAGAQTERLHDINGGILARKSGGACLDCAVKSGQLHVPGCDVEECPTRRGQAIACDCRGTAACDCKGTAEAKQRRDLLERFAADGEPPVVH